GAQVFKGARQVCERRQADPQRPFRADDAHAAQEGARGAVYGSEGRGLKTGILRHIRSQHHLQAIVGEDAHSLLHASGLAAVERKLGGAVQLIGKVREVRHGWSLIWRTRKMCGPPWARQRWSPRYS